MATILVSAQRMMIRVCTLAVLELQVLIESLPLLQISDIDRALSQFQTAVHGHVLVHHTMMHPTELQLVK